MSSTGRPPSPLSLFHASCWSSWAIPPPLSDLVLPGCACLACPLLLLRAHPRACWLQVRMVAHHGGVNRVRAMPQQPHIAATWGETGHVQVPPPLPPPVCVAPMSLPSLLAPHARLSRLSLRPPPDLPFSLPPLFCPSAA